jgi:hypothetical protein
MQQDTARVQEDATIAALLLIVQASLNLVSALGTLAYAAYGSAISLLVGLLTVLVAAAGFVAAGGVIGCRRWARRLALILQWLMILDGLATLLPHPGIGISIIALLTNLVVPLAIIRLVRRWRRIAPARVRDDLEVAARAIVAGDQADFLQHAP